MMTRALMSLLMIGVVAAVAGAGTLAYFTDTETSAGNTFTAGQIDLKVDWKQSGNWNGRGYSQQQTPIDNPGAIFSVGDIKPGDKGEATISLHLDSNPAYLKMTLSNIKDLENTVTDPESKLNPADTGPAGELGANMIVTIWEDNYASGTEVRAGDNVYQEGHEKLLYHGPASGVPTTPVALNNGVAVNPGTFYLGFAWEVPTNVGNIIQTDSYSVDMTFDAEQARHNP